MAAAEEGGELGQEEGTGWLFLWRVEARSGRPITRARTWHRSMSSRTGRRMERCQRGKQARAWDGLKREKEKREMGWMETPACLEFLGFFSNCRIGKERKKREKRKEGKYKRENLKNKVEFCQIIF